jgi:phosphopentomutase
MIMKRKLTIDNLLTFCNLGYFGSYGHNVREVLLYTKRLEYHNRLLAEKIKELQPEIPENTIEIKVEEF